MFALRRAVCATTASAAAAARSSGSAVSTKWLRCASTLPSLGSQHYQQHNSYNARWRVSAAASVAAVATAGLAATALNNVRVAPPLLSHATTSSHIRSGGL